jgi:hypothetical protein
MYFCYFYNLYYWLGTSTTSFPPYGYFVTFRLYEFNLVNIIRGLSWVQAQHR